MTLRSTAHASVRNRSLALALVSLCLLGSAALPSTALATGDETEPDSTGMSIRLANCLEAADDYRSENDMHDCIGIHSRPCIMRPESDNTRGMEICYIQELHGWEALLRSYERIAPASFSVPGPLRDTQVAWEAYRDARCNYYRVHYDGGSMARWMGARCVMIETARRVIDLSPFVDDWAS